MTQLLYPASNSVLNKIYNMDCIEGMKEIPDNFIDLVVTDPPYGDNYKTNRRKDTRQNRVLGFNKPILNDDDNSELISNYIKECYRIMKNNTPIYIFCNWSQSDFFRQEIEKYFELKNIIIWDKGNHGAGDLEGSYGNRYEMILFAHKGRCKFYGGRLEDIWNFSKVSGKELIHQNQKPQSLIERCIEQNSKINDIVLDGFLGSGTTAFAAKKLGRQFLGFELKKYYYDIANEKLLRIKIDISIQESLEPKKPRSLFI